MTRDDIAISEEVLCLSCASPSSGGGGSSSGTPYGLLDLSSHRLTRFNNKYRERCKLLGILFIVVTVIAGSTAFIYSHYHSTEVYRPVESDGPEREALRSSAVFIPSRQDRKMLDSTQHAKGLTQDGNKGKVVESIHSTSGRNGRSEEKNVKEGNDAMLSDEASTQYLNPNVTCHQHVKRLPKDKSEVSPERFPTLEFNPISLLEEMRECPTFTYEKCVKNSTRITGGKVDVGFIAHGQARSDNRTFNGYGTSKKVAKKDAAYRIALVLYPDVPNNNNPEPPISAEIKRADCEFV